MSKLLPVGPITWPDAEKGYIAGILDGEGSIFIALGGNSAQAILTISITNTNSNLLAFLENRIGIVANYSVTKYPAGVRGKKPNWIMTISGASALKVLLAIEPFLTIKRQRAIKGIEFQRLSSDDRRRDARGEEYRAIINGSADDEVA